MARSVVQFRRWRKMDPKARKKAGRRRFMNNGWEQRCCVRLEYE